MEQINMEKYKRRLEGKDGDNWRKLYLHCEVDVLIKYIEELEKE